MNETSTNAELFFRRMSSVEALNTLIGEPETADFDCKEWSDNREAVRGSIAKAACGFTNATGGVIVIGMVAKGRGKDLPDLVQSLAPVKDRQAVESEVLDIILKLVEPGVEGIRTKSIGDGVESKAGYVLVFVPASDGAPRRSKIDWKFYVRVSSGTLPMEYFQVEERFGRRPLPRLSLFAQGEALITEAGHKTLATRKIVFGLTNDGRGIAKFPGIRFKRLSGLTKHDLGIDGDGGFGIPPRASESNWIAFRGGVDDVIYPGETRLIGKLAQLATYKDIGIPPKLRPGQVTIGFDEAERTFSCESLSLEYEISAEEPRHVSECINCPKTRSSWLFKSVSEKRYTASSLARLT